MAPHSSTLAWKIPWMEEPGGLQSMGSRRVGHDWATSLSLFTFIHWRRKWQPTPVFLPGESQGQGSLVCCRLWGRRVGHDWSDLPDLPACFSEGREFTCNAGDRSSTPGLGTYPGEGKGSELQHPCLENPMGREARQTMGHGVAKSQTRLSDWHSSLLRFRRLPSVLSLYSISVKSRNCCPKFTADEKALFLILWLWDFHKGTPLWVWHTLWSGRAGVWGQGGQNSESRLCPWRPVNMPHPC